MGLTGKYNFPGIKKMGARGLLLAISSIPIVGKIFTAVPFLSSLTWGILQLVTNWLANEGLVVLNIGAIAVEGAWDQRAFDGAMDDAFKKIHDHTGELTPEQVKAIDDEVIKAARKFIRIGNGAVGMLDDGNK